MYRNGQEINFILPPEGTFQQNGPTDPLAYYYKPIIGRIYKRRIQAGLNLLDPPYDCVLEFGYGSGLLLPTLGSISKELFGIDIDADLLKTKISLEKLNIRAKLDCSDITTANYSSNSFDLIVAFSVFEHIRDPEPIIKEMTRILRPGGELLVGMPRVDEFMEKLFLLIGCKEINQYHITNYGDFLKTSEKYLKLIKFSKMPAFLPSFAGLYFNMLFRKMP